MHVRTMGRDAVSDRGATRGMCAQRREFNTSSLFIFCVVVCWSQHAVHCESYIHFLVRTLPEYCPYSNFCTMTPSKQLDRDKYSPCCKPCSCEDDCQLFGTCCPDFTAVVDSKQSMQQTVPCLVPVHYNYDGLTQFINEYAANLGLQSFYTFKTCPDGYNNEDVIRKCMHSNIQDQRGMAMVSDAGGRVFHNRYCAKCNGVTSFTQWNLKLLCKKAGFTGNDVFDVKQLEDKQCSIISSPPDGINAMASRCFQIHYSKCNITGIWKRFDSNIQRACESSLFPFVNEIKFPIPRIFNNPYCYLCNNNKAISGREQKCQKDTIDQQLKTNSDVSFSAVFNMEEVFDASSSSKCPLTNTFDHRLGTCRPLHCPSAMMARNGKCVSLFTEMHGLSKFIHIEAKFTHAVKDSEYSYFFDDYLTMEKFADGLSKDIGVPRCNGCTGEWLRRKDETGVTILLGFGTNQHCSLTTLIDAINAWRLKLKDSPRFYVKKDTKQISFSVDLAYGITSTFPQTDEHLDKDRRFLFWNMYKSCVGSFLEPKFYCPYFDIPRKDYSKLMTTQNNTFHAMDFSTVTILNSTTNKTRTAYRICIDEYLGKHTSGANPYFISDISITTWFAMLSSFRLIFI